jgi:hypothetical protein
MGEFCLGIAVGGIVTGIVALWECHRHKTKRRVELEQEYAVLQNHVDKCVSSISRIIDGS